MKNWKSLPLAIAVLMTLTCGLVSCGEEGIVEDTAAYIVDVEIISPADNVTMSINENFTVEVDYARQENIIHNIKVEILDGEGNQVMNLVERHAHVANEFTFKAENIAIDQPGTYTLRATTTDLHLEGEGDSHGSDGANSDEHNKENTVEHTIVVQ